MTKDLMGREAKAGDIVAVGVTFGSSGGWLSIRRVTRVAGGKVYMRQKGTRHGEYPYRAAGGFLILPRACARLVDTTR